MSNQHQEEIPIDLHSFVTRIDELQTVFGASVVPILAAVKDSLLHAMAARDRGDMPSAWQRIREAMERLAAVAEHLDPQEAMAMRAIAQMFQAALTRGDASEAKRAAAVMLDNSGARPRKPD